MNFLRSLNWGLLAVLLVAASFWAAVGWILYRGLTTVQ